MENLLIYCALAALSLVCLGLAASLIVFHRRITRGISEAQTKISAYIAAINEESAKVQERLAALEDARAGAQRFSAKGVEAREQYQGRRQEALLAALQAYQSGKKPQEVLMEVAKSYPDVAAQYAANPMLALQDIKKAGITLPPELLASLAKVGAPAAQAEGENWYGIRV